MFLPLPLHEPIKRLRCRFRRGLDAGAGLESGGAGLGREVGSSDRLGGRGDVGVVDGFGGAGEGGGEPAEGFGQRGDGVALEFRAAGNLTGAFLRVLGGSGGAAEASVATALGWGKVFWTGGVGGA